MERRNHFIKSIKEETEGTPPKKILISPKSDLDVEDDVLQLKIVRIIYEQALSAIDESSKPGCYYQLNHSKL